VIGRGKPGSDCRRATAWQDAQVTVTPADLTRVPLATEMEASLREPASRPSGVQNANWRRLFNRASFHGLNSRDGQQVLLTEVHDETGRLLGGLSGVRDGDDFLSGYSAPFAGVDLLNGRETSENIARVVLDSLRQIQAAGVRSIRLKLPPACYSDNEAMVQFSLLNAGFAVERCELNQHLPVSEWSSAADFAERLRPPAQKTLRHLMTAELSFRQVEQTCDFDRAYELLLQSRVRKGRRFALTLDYLALARATLSPDVRMFDLLHEDRPIAAALVYRVAPGRDLVVAWGDGENELKRSPMIMLAYRLVERCLAEGVGMLDLGISNEPVARNTGGLEPNYGLVQFKRTLLARTEPRFTMVRVN
jgi:hypothetical protein